MRGGSQRGEGGVLLEPKYGGQEYKIFQNNNTGFSVFTEQKESPKEPPEEPEKKEQKKDGTESRMPNESVYKSKVRLARGTASEADPNKEYIELQASSNNQKLMPITGWVLKNSKNEEMKIGKGAYFVFSAQINQEIDILLAPGAKVYVNTPRSPIGANFQTNICTGYFEQFQDFIPSLRKDCPHPYKDISPSANLKDKCLDYIERLPRCEMPINNIPWDLDDACRKYLSENINYNSCVANHRKDKNFYSNEWRIYLGRGKELWKSRRETITLYDQLGKIIDSISY